MAKTIIVKDLKSVPVRDESPTYVCWFIGKQLKIRTTTEILNTYA